ncbi:hypothetical protein KZZ52_41655 [Dactylosporangium sp. AC04546]|uniref:hypothetical protein n=1 Tax=Dactylosporangium sp. AC04546 TaxID=2862460 RepID=UPI001EE089B8|nr:hypothetical protein [Dactylosporangium sp. AC04546]WVK80432.1 hypothetical protein KZZ52_41655 [Dactylosporangium sp. AC04546]
MEATRQWQRAASTPGRARRIVTATRLAWDATYPPAYAYGYATLASHAAGAFDTLRRRFDLSDAQHAEVRRLIELADRTAPRRQEPPAVPRRVLEAAAIAVMDRRDGRTAPEAVARSVYREAASQGGTDGALRAAEDIYGGWRMWVDRATLHSPVGEKTLEELLNTTFAASNRDLITEWTARCRRFDPAPAAVAGASFTPPPAESLLSVTRTTPTAPVVVALRRGPRR